MTTDILTFPGAERPSAEMPQITRESVAADITKAVHWYQQGRRLEDLPADMDPEMRRTMELILGVIEREARS